MLLEAEQADVADDPVRAEGGHVGGQDALAERRLGGGDRVVEVGVARVQLGQGDDPGQVGRGALVPQRLGGAVDAVGRRDHEDRGVGRANTGPELTDEVGVARRVQEVHQHAAVLHRGDVELGGPLRVLLLAAVTDDPGLEQLLEQ